MYQSSKIDWKKTLNNTDQYSVFRELLGYTPDLTKRYISPFREDKTPGCRFIWKDDILCLVENTKYKNRLYWNIFHTFMELKNCSFVEAVRLINKKEFSKTTITRQPVYKTRPEIKFTYSEFPKNNLFFLDNEILNKENIYYVKDYWIGNQGDWKKNGLNTKDNICIAYFFPNTNHVKLYFPYSKTNKWYSNCSTEDIFGFSQLSKFGDGLIITKSQKDRITLKYLFGVKEEVIALQNEGCLIPDNIIDNLKLRFKKISLLFDNDEEGIRQSEKLSELYGFEQIKIQGSYKDPYAFYTNFLNIY